MFAQELINATSPTIGKAGSAFYFHPSTLARGKEVGLDGFRFYMLGRGGVLGDVESDVVASAFGTSTGLWWPEYGPRPRSGASRGKPRGSTCSVVPTSGARLLPLWRA
jgi:hypothetical protein